MRSSIRERKCQNQGTGAGKEPAGFKVSARARESPSLLEISAASEGLLIRGTALVR